MSVESHRLRKPTHNGRVDITALVEGVEAVLGKVAMWLKSIPMRWVILLSLAFALRVWGLDFGLPNLSRPDEQNIANAAVLNILNAAFQGRLDLNPYFFNYPSLFIYATTICLGLYYLLGHCLGFFLDWDSFIQLYRNDWTSFLLIQRALSVLAGVFGVWAMARLGAALSDSNRFGLACGFLLAVTYLHVRDSHFGVTDISATTLATLSLWQSIQALREENQRALTRAAVLAGLAASTKYPLGLVAVAPILVFYLLARAQGAQGGDFSRKTALVKREIHLLLCLVGAFFLASPFVLFDFSTFWADFSWQQDSFQRVFEREDIDVGWIRHLNFSLLHGLGPMYLLAGLAGMVMAAWSREKIHWPLLTFAVLFYGVMGGNKTVFVRYAIPLIPIFCLYAVFCLEQIWKKLPGSIIARCVVLSILILLVSGPGLSQCLRLDWLLAQPDTRSSARNWLLQYLQPGDSVGVGKSLSHIDLPSSYAKYFLIPVEASGSSPHWPGHFMLPKEGKTAYLPNLRNEHNINTYNDVDFLRRKKIRYVAVASTPLKLFGTPDVELAALRNNPGLKLVAQFKNTCDERLEPPESAYDWEDAFYVPFTEPGALCRPGPTVLIYEVLPAAGRGQKSR